MVDFKLRITQLLTVLDILASKWKLYQNRAVEERNPNEKLFTGNSQARSDQGLVSEQLVPKSLEKEVQQFRVSSQTLTTALVIPHDMQAFDLEICLLEHGISQLRFCGTYVVSGLCSGLQTRLGRRTCYVRCDMLGWFVKSASKVDKKMEKV